MWSSCGVFSEKIIMKLGINNKKNIKNEIKTWKLNNLFLDNQWVKEKLRRKF